VLELLDDLQSETSFHQVDELMEGLSNLSPRRFKSCCPTVRSVKVKRLFPILCRTDINTRGKTYQEEDDIDLGKKERGCW